MNGIYTDELSGATAERPGLQDAMDYARDRDVLLHQRAGACMAA